MSPGPAPTRRTDVRTACAWTLLVAGGAAAALVAASGPGGSDEPPEDAPPDVVTRDARDDVAAPDARPAAESDSRSPAPRDPDARTGVAPAADGNGRLALPAAVLGRPSDRKEDRPPVRAWVVEEALDDPSGIRVAGPHEVVFDDDGRGSVPVGGRVFRWWVQCGDAWRRGDETADAPGGASHVRDAAWGAHGLLRVLDASGRSVEGIEVTLQRSEAQHRQELARVTTDADGLALFRLPGEGPSRHRPAPPPTDATVFRVEVPAVPPITAPYAREGPWPVVLRLPPLGAVHVTLSAADGSEPAGQVRLDALVEGTQATGFVPSVLARVSSSGARFRHVAPGLRFSATCMPGDTRVTTRVEFDGPHAEGSTSTVALPFGALRPVLTGRLLRADGGPVHPGFVQVSVPVASAASPWSDRSQGAGATDAEGRFEVRLDADLSGVGDIELTVASGAQELLRRRIASVAPGGRVDLGDLRVAEGPGGAGVPLLVAGRVLDVDGSPAANVPLTVWRKRRDRWQPLPGPPHAASADGTFEFRRAAEPGGAWEVRPTFLPDGAGRVADAVPFEPGATGVALRLRTSETLRVRVLLPPGLADGHGLWVVLEGEAAGTEPQSLTIASGLPVADPAGSAVQLQFRGLRPGAGRLVVHPPGLPERVLVAREVAVGAGSAADAGTLDLRGLVPVRTVRVLGADGKGAADGAVWWRSSDATSWNPWNPVVCRPDGTARVPCAAPVDLLARRTGSGFAEAFRVTADATLTPPPPGRASAVEVRLADGRDVPAAPFRFAVRLSRTGTTGPRLPFGDETDPRNHGRPTLDLDRTTRRARFEVVETGRYVARLSLLLDRPDGGSSGVAVEAEGDASTEVGADGAARTIVLRFASEVLAEASAELRGD